MPDQPPAAATNKLLTAGELEELSAESECRYDLIRGQLLTMAPAGFRHGRIAARIVGRLESYGAPRGWVAVAAETGFILARNPDTVLGPDAALVRADRLPSEAEQEHYLELVPDVAVEVVSPSDRARDVSDKVMEYLEAGVRQVWLVEPRRRIVTVYEADRSAQVLTDADTIDGDELLPGFSLPVRALFE
jgi:Uma2 family endonuclease